jgi:hypothetical protein
MEPKYPVNEEYEKLLKEIDKNIKRLPQLKAMAENQN